MSPSLSFKLYLGNISKHTPAAHFHYIQGVTQGEQPCAHNYLLKTAIVPSYTHLYTDDLMTGVEIGSASKAGVSTQVTLSRGSIT